MATNVSNPPKKKKSRKVIGYKKVVTPGKQIEKGEPLKVAVKVTPGKTTKAYKPADERTGDPAYGKESKTKPTPQFVKDAQAKKQDIVEKGGLKYRAGYTSTKTEPNTAKATTSFKPGFKTPDKVTYEPVYEKTAAKKGKLKAMAMTYGTDSPTKGGGTKYKKKVRVKKK